MDNRLSHLGFADKLTSLGGFETMNNVTAGGEHHTDTTLRLESPGSSSLHSSNLTGTNKTWSKIGRKEETLDYAPLVLGLGRPPNSPDRRRRSTETMCTMSSTKETDDGCSMHLGMNFQLHMGNESTSSPRDCSTNFKRLNNGCIPDLNLPWSLGLSESVLTSITPVPRQHKNTVETSVTIDEEPSSSFSEHGRHLLPYLFPSKSASDFSVNREIPAKVDPLPNPDLSSTMTQPPRTPDASTSGVTQQRNTNTRRCQFQGCGKGARGASGLCITHGGGRRCQKDGCQKGAEGRTIYCKAHGGGRRCEYLGCPKSAEGRTDFCIAHGGGHRCSREGCTRAARGKSGLCIRHGGGKRCKKENCPKSAEGHSGLCISHGGGRRCQYPECPKGAQGSTMLCKAHGGGKRCIFPGCSKGAEGSTSFCKGHGGGKRCSFHGCGKSVHGGTQFCVAHGGGKRCAIPECSKSARGRTDFCVRHGGGKRCRFDGCGKSAQGSTDYCKAHGGGNRCSWGLPGSEGAGGPPCDRFARGKIGLCAAHGALVQDQRVHGDAFVGPLATEHPTTSKPEKMKGIAFEEGMFLNIGSRRERVVDWNMHHLMPGQSSLVSFPEGRVHGGSLLAKLASSASPGSHSGGQIEGGTSEQGLPYRIVYDQV